MPIDSLHIDGDAVIYKINAKDEPVTASLTGTPTAQAVIIELSGFPVPPTAIAPIENGTLTVYIESDPAEQNLKPAEENLKLMSGKIVGISRDGKTLLAH